MKVFLIILAVLVVIFTVILSLSAEFTIVFDNGWSTKIRILFIEKDIELSKILSFVLFPDKSADQAKTQMKETKNKKQKSEKKEETQDTSEKEAKKKKPNYIKKVIDQDGVAGLMLLISNFIETAGSALGTLIKGLHIYSLYVKMIIGGGDAADIGEKYGSICGFYYPIKGFVLNSMKVDMYDDYVQPDFIAPRSEYEFQLIASINVALILKIVLSSGKVFISNLIKDK